MGIARLGGGSQPLPGWFVAPISESEFEVETLYLTAGIIIFDTLVPRAFQKYTTYMVFKAVQLFKKSAT